MNVVNELIASAVYHLQGYLFNYHYDEYRTKSFHHIFPCITDKELFAKIDYIKTLDEVQEVLKKDFHYNLLDKLKHLRNNEKILFSTHDFSINTYKLVILDKEFVDKELEEYNSIKELITNSYNNINTKINDFNKNI